MRMTVPIFYTLLTVQYTDAQQPTPKPFEPAPFYPHDLPLRTNLYCSRGSRPGVTGYSRSKPNDALQPLHF